MPLEQTVALTDLMFDDKNIRSRGVLIEIKLKFLSACLLFVCMISFSSVLFAQDNGMIRGRITEKSSQEPLPGVTLIERDQNNRIINGVITNINGDYVLEVKDIKNQIRASFVGFETQIFSVDNRTVINIELEQSSTELEEIVVIAKAESDNLTGVSTRDQTGSSVKVDMASLIGQAGVSVASALQGQVSGLDIVSASGAPGSGSSIVIRGMGSIGNTNPLIVIDGIPQDVSSDNFNFASADQHDLGQLLNIPPQDIKSVEVLKDAATTAVWGSKGANGVLVIETNKGTRGKINFNYQYKLDANIEPSPLPMLNGDEYTILQREEWHNAFGVYEIPPEIAYDRNFSDYYNYSDNTDWIGAITQNSFTHDHFFKLSGGSANSRYYTSVNHHSEVGTTINTSFERFSVRANFDYDISDKLRLTTNLNYTNTFREDNPETELRYRGRRMNIRQLAYIKAPNMSIWEHDEYGNLTGEYFTPIESYQGDGDLYLNPVAVSNLGMNDVEGNQIQNNFVINYKIANWITFKESLSFSYNNNKGKQFMPSSAIGADWLDYKNNLSNERNFMNLRLLSRSQLFLYPLRKSRVHSMTGVLMWEMEEKTGEYLTLINQKSPSMYITDPARNSPNLPQGQTSSSSSKSRLLGALSSFNYKYKDKYLITANLRADASSSFGGNNSWGLFPSLSAGWRFSEEDFLSSLAFLDESKLRLSWGQSGKAIDNDNYPTYSYYETSGRYLDLPVISPAQMQLDNLRWQTVTSWNAGIDLNLFKQKVYIMADIYKKETNNLLWKNYGIPGSTSYGSLKYYNGGELQNVGWEFFTRSTVFEGEEFHLSLNFNISQNFNSFESFPQNFNLIQGSDIGNGVYPMKAEVGKPIGSFYGFRYLGVYPSDEDAYARNEAGDIIVDSQGEPIPMTYNEVYQFKGGDAIYEDRNHDGKIDIMDVVYIGDSNPEVIGGLGTSAQYKQFSVSVNFHYRLGFDIINIVAMDTEGMLDRNNQSLATINRWRRQGQDEEGLLPRAYINHPANNLGSDRYVEQGDFLRLNSLNLSYRVGRRIASKLNLNGLEIRAVMRNLMTFTNYTGQDPEIARVSTNPFFLGTDRAQTPPAKIYSLAVNMNF
ncbi:MAG: SusC/RagA family TonB-linked outer membrane protein [Bacteroidales bacterium]|nr:SusC/RagA family TonB-linked outer membrane protein [Bacteroidales bacterium]